MTATQQQQLIDQLVTSLRAVLPYAENECASLHEAERRDGDDCGAKAAGTAIEAAQAVLGLADALASAADAIEAPSLPRVLVVMDGGCVHDIRADHEVEVLIVDEDTEGSDEEPASVTFPGDDPVDALLFHWRPDLDVEFVDAGFEPLEVRRSRH